MKFVFFSVSVNEENGLGDEGAEGQCLPPSGIFGLEPTLEKRRCGQPRTSWKDTDISHAQCSPDGKTLDTAVDKKGGTAERDCSVCFAFESRGGGAGGGLGGS